MTSLTSIDTDDSLSFAQKIIMKNNTELRAKIEKLRIKLAKLSKPIETDQRASYLKPNDYDQIKISLSEKTSECEQLKSSLSEKTSECDQLKTEVSTKVIEYDKLYDMTKDILNTNKSSLKQSLKQSFEKICLTSNNKAIEEIMIKEEYEKLLSYKFFDIEYLFDCIGNSTGMMSDEIMKHIIDHCLDINAEININSNPNFNYDSYTSTRLIHLFCRHSDKEELIKYLIDKEGIELECPDKEGNYPLHLICMCSTFEMAKYIIGKGVNTKLKSSKSLVKIIRNGSFTSDEIDELISIL